MPMSKLLDIIRKLISPPHPHPSPQGGEGVRKPRSWLRGIVILRQRAGFTLVEMLVALALVALMFGIVSTQVGDWFDSDIKEATNRLSSTIRYLHDKAASQNLYIRLSFDFEKNSYWVEATTEQFLLTTKEVFDAEQLEIQQEMEDGEEEAAPVEEGEEGEAGAGETVTYVKKYRTPEFGAVDEYLLKPVSLPKTVFLKDIYTSHDNGPVSSGVAFIYFFPNGYIEPAIINLRDEDDEVNFSIEINPIIGSTYIRDEYKAMEIK